MFEHLFAVQVFFGVAISSSKRQTQVTIECNSVEQKGIHIMSGLVLGNSAASLSKTSLFGMQGHGGQISHRCTSRPELLTLLGHDGDEAVLTSVDWEAIKKTLFWCMDSMPAGG